MPEGVVTRVLAGFFDVTDGSNVVRCRARGVFRKRKTTVLVGDRVTYQVTNEAEGLIEDVFPRVSELVRPPVANVTQAVLVFSAANPEFQGFLLDKALVVVGYEGLESLIVISKVDFVSEAELDELVTPYRTAGYEVVPTSVPDGQGMTELLEQLRGHTSVFVGPSGVGKSSLGNALAPGLGLKMGDISERMGRGKHTTRHTELFLIDKDTFVADAAGFSQLQVDVPSSEIRFYFPEFNPYAEKCPYRGCVHLDESECAVKDAVENGDICARRYESYHQLYVEVHHQEATRY